MTPRLFGTDGVRGLAGTELSPEFAVGLARAAVIELAGARRPVVVVGRDPRASGEMLEAAVIAGLTSAGADVLRAGVLPTPAVAFLTGGADADFGVVLSASHNPMPDNGIKIFSRGGRKLPDDVEDRIEARLAAASGPDHRPTGAAMGRVREFPNAAESYVQHLLGLCLHPLHGLRIVVDCANGSASGVAPEVYRRAGASVTAIAESPDGRNINEQCGSTHLDGLRAAVRSDAADVGIAHDGDADRCLAMAADGSVVDGDAIIAICALAMGEAGRLRHNAVVGTVMSNLGFHRAMREHGIEVVTTPVGDRYVLEALAGRDLSLGGEASGHVVFPDDATTGDGLLTALHLLARLAATGKPLAELASVMRRLPQVLLNVRVSDKTAVARSSGVADAVADAERRLGDGGRVLLRPSGTEQLIRVMVEAPTEEEASAVAAQLATVVGTT